MHTLAAGASPPRCLHGLHSLLLLKQFSKDMQKNTSAQTDEGANVSTNQSRRDAHTESKLRFTQLGKGAQELGVERQVQGHGACELASAATLADEPTDSHVNHAARGTASHEKRERRAAAHAFIYATRARSFACHAQRVCILDAGAPLRLRGGGVPNLAGVEAVPRVEVSP